MGFPQALSETRVIQAEVPTNLIGNLFHSLCWKAFPQPLLEGYTIHNLAARNRILILKFWFYFCKQMNIVFCHKYKLISYVNLGTNWYMNIFAYSFSIEYEYKY